MRMVLQSSRKMTLARPSSTLVHALVLGAPEFSRAAEFMGNISQDSLVAECEMPKNLTRTGGKMI